MSDARHNEVLNGLLIRLYRSLLQYTKECWPWADASQGDERRAIDELAEKQMGQVARMVELLQSRQWPIDFDNYPDWTELHYVSLDYLLSKLIEDQKQVLAAAQEAQKDLTDDPPARALAEAATVSEQRYLTKLKEIAAERNHPAMA